MRGRTVALMAASVVVTAALIVAGCTSGARTTAKVTAADDGKTIELATGGKLTVELESNPSTGFDWYLDGDLPSQLATATDDFKQGGKPGVVGAGGTRTIVYDAVASGTATLKLVYVRVWETGVKPEKTFTVTVAVK